MSETVGYSPWPVIWDVDTEGVSNVVGGNVVSSVPECVLPHRSPRPTPRPVHRCTEPSCTAPHDALGLCGVHYQRLRRRNR